MQFIGSAAGEEALACCNGAHAGAERLDELGVVPGQEFEALEKLECAGPVAALHLALHQRGAGVRSAHHEREEEVDVELRSAVDVLRLRPPRHLHCRVRVSVLGLGGVDGDVEEDGLLVLDGRDGEVEGLASALGHAAELEAVGNVQGGLLQALVLACRVEFVVGVEAALDEVLAVSALLEVEHCAELFEGAFLALPAGEELLAQPLQLVDVADARHEVDQHLARAPQLTEIRCLFLLACW
mmetsp:Transcript_15107/g.59142  ORF Transcript_15107/g.59142 Transcript_15107/m.59142 type:complete len:241 (+) Transcript_15107:19-741(+)